MLHYYLTIDDGADATRSGEGQEWAGAGVNGRLVLTCAFEQGVDMRPPDRVR